MTEETMTGTEAPEEVKQEVSPEYLVVMYDEEETWEFPGSGGKYFITAKHPGMNQDKIRSAMAPGGSVRQTKEGTESNIRIAEQREAGFVEKCVCQITDYKFFAQVRDEKGKVYTEERTYRPNAKGEGETKHNRENYTAWLRCSFRDEIEAFLDRKAGGTPAAQEDFEDLGEEPGQ